MTRVGVRSIGSKAISHRRSRFALILTGISLSGLIVVVVAQGAFPVEAITAAPTPVRAPLPTLAHRDLRDPFPTSTNYSVTFTEAGLPAGTNWDLILLNSSWNFQVNVYTNRATFPLPNGTDYFEASPISSLTYVGYNASGYFTVNGSNLSINMSFVRTFTVAFVESGGPSGGVWAVILGGVNRSSNTSTIGFLEPNGTGASYVVFAPPGYISQPATGAVMVNGSALSTQLLFARNATAPTYPVWFNETGLSPGIAWSVSVESWTNGTKNASLRLDLPNGSGYPFAVGPPQGYDPSPRYGSFDVGGRATVIPIIFTSNLPPPTYPLWFNQTGLPPAATWSATARLAGSVVNLTPTYASLNSTEFELTAGVAGNFSIAGPGGYTALPASGMFQIPSPGAPLTVVITFSSIPPPLLVISSFTISPASALVGQEINLTVAASGGSAPVSFVFSGLPPPCLSRDAAQLSCRPNASGVYRVHAVVTDRLQRTIGANATLTVTAAPAPTHGASSNILGIPAGQAYALGAGGVIAVLAGVGLIVRFRRRGPPPTQVSR